MFKKIAFIGMFVAGAGLGAMDRASLELSYAPGVLESFAQEDKMTQKRIESAIEDIFAERKTPNIKPLGENFFEYKFRDGARLYFMKQKNNIIVTGFDFKRNNNQQERFIRAMLNNFMRSQQTDPNADL